METTKFYNEVAKVIATLPGKFEWRFLVLGEFNARVGNTEELWEEVRGSALESEEENENLLEFCKPKDVRLQIRFLRQLKGHGHGEAEEVKLNRR